MTRSEAGQGVEASAAKAPHAGANFPRTGHAEQHFTDIQVQARVADGDDVITWFDLHTTVAAPAPTANWSHVENGRIAQIRVTFDPREIVAGPG